MPQKTRPLSPLENSADESGRTPNEKLQEKTAKWAAGREQEKRPPKGFVDVPRFAGRFAAARDGRIFSYSKSRVITPRLTDNGYHSVRVTKGKANVPRHVHALVCRTFIGLCPRGSEVDHINRVKTDNRVANLRYVSHSFNQHNHHKHVVRGSSAPESKFKGVHYMSSGVCAKWRATISVAGRMLIIGRFHHDMDAAMAYDEVATAIYQDRAVTNKSLGLL